MKKTTLLFLALFVAAPFSGLAQVYIEVLQGGVSKGIFSAYSGSATAAVNFNYSSSSDSSNPAIGPSNVAGEEQIFFYRETGSGNLFFNTIFRIGGTPTSTRSLDWNIAVDHTGAAPTVVVSDDTLTNTQELKFVSTVSGTSTFTGYWNWDQLHTDGGVIGALLGNWEIRIDPFGTTPYNTGVGGEDLQVYGATGSPIALLKDSQQIVFRPVTVPDPGSTLLLVALGLAGLVAARRAGSRSSPPRKG